MKKENIACIGAGQIGRSWAIVFARKGYKVKIYDIEDNVIQDALDEIGASLADLRMEGLMNDERVALAQIHPTSDLFHAVHDAEIIIESVIEDAEVKRQLMSELQGLAPPDAKITSSTSSIPGSEFMGHTEMREKCLIAHPINPPHLLPVIEFCATPWTAQDAYSACWKLMKQVGLHPVEIKKEIPAFVANRLQSAMLGEALYLVDTGVISVKDLDVVIKHGFGRRLAFTGIFENLHLSKSSSFTSSLEKNEYLIRNMINETNVKHVWSKGLLDKIAEERDGLLPPEKVQARKAWRDRLLIKIAKIWSDIEKEQC